MAKNPVRHKKPITGSSNWPYRETGMRNFGFYLWWAFCLPGDYKGLVIIKMFFKKKTEIEKSWIDQANKSSQFVRPALSFIVSDAAEHLTKVLKDEGVTDTDIKWWYGLSDVERNAIIQHNQETILMTHYHFHKTLGLSGEDLVRKVCQTMIIYGIFPLQQDHIKSMSDLGFSANDYQLPWELSTRIGKYSMEEMSKGEESFREKLKGFSTINAFLRNKIKNGEIKAIDDYSKLKI